MTIDILQYVMKSLHLLDLENLILLIQKLNISWYFLPIRLVTLLLNSHFLFLAGWKTVRHFGSLQGGANLVLPSGVLQGGLYNNL